MTSDAERDGSFAKLFQMSPLPFLVLAPDAPRFTVVQVNDSYLAVASRTREELVGCGILAAFPDNPDEGTSVGASVLRGSLERVIEFKQPDTLLDLRYDVARADGTFEERWWNAVNSPVLDGSGGVESIIHNPIDVTEAHQAVAALRDSEERLTLLVAELQHRTRNLLAVVGGIADQSRATSVSLDDFGLRFDRRLAALGRVQGLLSTGPLPSVDLAELLALELDAHGIDLPADPSIGVSGPDVALSADTVQLLALALHELTTNALKHGALKAGGRLSIEWTVSPAEDGRRRLVLDWRESGVAIGGDLRRGFGRELIEENLPYELDAITSLRFGPDGVACRIDVLLPAPTSADLSRVIG